MKIVGEGIQEWGAKIIKLWRGNKKIEMGNVVKKCLLSLTILIDFFRIAVYLTLFVSNGILGLILLLAIISRVF